MIFEKEKYYKYIQNIETTIKVAYIVIMIISVLIGIATGGAPLLITIPIGILISWCYTINAKIKVQEMRWKFDIYDRIMKNKEVV